jgi:putative DNA primase/helicase
MTLEDRAARALDELAARAEKETRRKKNPRPTERDAVALFDPSGRRVIRHDAGRLPQVLDELGAALAEADLGLFVFAGRLVRLHVLQEPQEGVVRRPRAAVVLHPAEPDHLVELAGLAATHEKFDRRADEYRPCDCPRRVAASFLARGAWPELPTVAGVVEAPTLRADGRLLDRPGYDAESGLYLAFADLPGYTSPPPSPSRDDAEEALAMLLQTIDSFPLVDYSDRCAVLAGFLTALVRRSLPSAPMLGITAPAAGSGKSLLAEGLAVGATGRHGAMLSIGSDDAEMEKRLAGVLLAGDAVVILDNLERPLRSELLCSILTQSAVRLRPLGGSSVLTVPTSACFVATANNLQIHGDLRRRTMLARIDAGVERPERRRFERDFLADLAARRGELIRALLTIPLAYRAAGSPEISDLEPVGSFAQWDRLVRRPLVWAGLPDPMTAAEELRQDDPDVAAARQLFAAWRGVFGDRRVSAAEVVEAGMAMQPMSGERETPELYAALQLVCSEKPNVRRLGYWLRSHRGRIVDGLRLESAGIDAHSKIALWRVSCG